MACTVDFRSLDEGFGGKTYKRKRSEQADELARSLNPIEEEETSTMDVDAPAKRQAVASSDNPDKPAVVFGRPTYDGVIAGKVSGRKWKEPRTRRSSAMNVSKKPSTHEQRAREKEIKKAYRERMGELKEEIRSNKAEKRKKRVEREKRKEENILRSGTKLQKISNPKTLKKIAKSKQRKQLKVVPDNFLNNSNGKNKKN